MTLDSKRRLTGVWSADVARRAQRALQRGHELGESPSKSSIRVRSSHSPHHGGRRLAGGRGSFARASRAASTGTGVLIPPLFAPAELAQPPGVLPVPDVAVTQG